MSVAMKGNWIMAQPGGPAYKVASNFTNYLELGSPGRTAHHLQARIEDGNVVARDEGDDFLVFKGPAILGRSGESIGIVIEQ